MEVALRLDDGTAALAVAPLGIHGCRSEPMEPEDVGFGVYGAHLRRFQLAGDARKELQESECSFMVHI